MTAVFFHDALATILGVVSLAVIVGEFWTGIAIIGLSGDRLVIEREKFPAQYWFVLVLHAITGIGLQLLVFAT